MASNNLDDDGQTSVDKAIGLLIAVGELGMQTSDVVPMNDLIAKTGLSRPTAHRLLGHLKRFGLVEQTARTGAYGLGRRVLVLGAQHRNGVDLRRIAQATLRDLVERTGYTAHLGVQIENEVVFIEKVESSHGIHIASAIGQRRKMNCTAIGKALLAYKDAAAIEQLMKDGLPAPTRHSLATVPALLRDLEETRRRGYSLDNEEMEIGVRCAGAPIFDHDETPVAAISVTAIAFSLDEGGLHRIGVSVADTARQISERLGAPARR